MQVRFPTVIYVWVPYQALTGSGFRLLAGKKLIVLAIKISATDQVNQVRLFTAEYNRPEATCAPDVYNRQLMPCMIRALEPDDIAGTWITQTQGRARMDLIACRRVDGKNVYENGLRFGQWTLMIVNDTSITSTQVLMKTLHKPLHKTWSSLILAISVN